MRLTRDIRQQIVDLAPFETEQINIGEASLLLASMDRPGVPVQPYQRHLQILIDGVRDYVTGEKLTASIMIEALHQIIIRRFGYNTPDTVDVDLHDLNLMRVIDNRNGSALCLGILTLHVACQLNWHMSGINFPGTFLLRTVHRGKPVIFDLLSGQIANVPEMRLMLKAVQGQDAELEPAHYTPLSDRDLLLTLCDRVKRTLLAHGKLEPVRHLLDAMLLIDKDNSRLWREAGLISARLDHVAEAVNALEEYLKRSAMDEARYDASVLLQELKQKLN